MATDPLEELKRRRAGALTPAADPLDELKRRRSLMKDTAVSPLLEETPFTVSRPSLPEGPRASKPLPKVTTEAPAPARLERTMARAVLEGTKKTQPFGGEESLSKTEQQKLERARAFSALAEKVGEPVADVGMQVFSQPVRTALRTVTGAANIGAQLTGRGAPTGLNALTKTVEEETAPRTAIGGAARFGAEIVPYLYGGVLSSAARTGLESASGPEQSQANMLLRWAGKEEIESPIARALADAGLDMAIPGLLAARRGYKAVREVGDIAGDAFTQGLREGAGEAVEAATPSLARKDGYRPREVPEMRPERILPSRASQTVPIGTEPAPVTGPMQGPAIPSPAGVARPEGPATPLMRLLTAQSEASRQRQFQMPPAYGPTPLPEGALDVQGAASSTMRQLPAQAESVRQRLLQMPPAGGTTGPFPEFPPVVEAPVRPQAGRRPMIGQALPPQGLPSVATPEELAKYLAGKALGTKEKISTLARAGEEAVPAPAKRVKPEVALEKPIAESPSTPKRLSLDEEARIAQELEAEDAARRGGEPPRGLEDVPVEKIDEALYPDKSVRLKDSETRDAALMAAEAVKKNVPTSLRVLAKASVRQLQAMASKAALELEQATFLDEWYNTVGSEIKEAGGALRPEKGKSGAVFYNKYNQKVIDERGKQLVSPADLRRNGMYTEDELAYAFDRHGLDSETYHEMQTAGLKAAKAADNAREGIKRIEAEIARRGYTAEGVQSRPGFAASPVAGALGGFGAGATAGATSEDDGTMTPLQKALLYGAAGVAGGAFAMKRMGAGRQVVTPSIPELAPIAETINIGKREAQREAPSFLSKFGKFYNNLVSETYVLEKAAEKFGSAMQAKNLRELVAQKQGSRRAAQGYLEDKLTPLIKDLSKSEMDNVRALLKARRELQILQQGGASKSATSLEDLQRAVAAGNADAKTASVADAVTAMHRDLLAKRYQAGLLTDEAYEAIKASDDFYTPFFREAAQDPNLGGMLSAPKSGGFNILGTGVKKMDRTAEALEKTADPFETLIVDAARTYRDVAKQRVSNVIFNIADTGDLPFLQRIKADPMNPPKGDDIIQQMRNGKLYTYRVTDKDLFNALAGQESIASNAAVKFANLMKTIKTTGITILPDFAAANVIRDVAMSGIQRPDLRRAAGEAATAGLASGTFAALTGDEDESVVKRFLQGASLGAGAGLYARPFAQTMQAVGSIVGNTKIYREFLADGASTEGFYVRNASDAAKALKDLKGLSPEDIIIPSTWVETLRKIGSIGEQATRVAAYRQLREAGASGAEAALAAQDRTLRFAQSGGSRTVKSIAGMTPFWNAKVQGWDKLARMLKDPKTYPMAAGMLTAPSIALWSINKDNPEYWERPAYEKNLFWLVPKNLIGDEGEKGFYRIPKPFELGYMFASLPERALDYATQKGLDLPFIGEIQSASPVVAEPGSGLKRAAAEMAGSTFEGTIPFPDIAAIPVQLMQNKDFFRGQPIVTSPQLSPKLQVTEETSAIARALAKAGVSPQKTEFVIRNVFGTAGAEASKLVDIGARKLGVEAPEAQAGAAGIPLVGRFKERFTTSTKGQTDPEAMARERLRELNQIERDLRELERRAESGAPKDRKRLVDFAAENYDDIKLAQNLQSIETQLEKLSRDRTSIRKDPTLTPEDRKIVLEVLRKRGQKLSEQLIGVPKQ